jgi:hypothetical protein
MANELSGYDGQQGSGQWRVPTLASRVATVKVKWPKAPLGWALINVSEYDPQKHELADGENIEVARGMPVTIPPVVMPDFDKWTVDALIEYAGKKGVKLNRRAGRQALIDECVSLYEGASPKR